MLMPGGGPLQIADRPRSCARVYLKRRAQPVYRVTRVPALCAEPASSTAEARASGRGPRSKCAIAWAKARPRQRELVALDRAPASVVVLIPGCVI
jgi:hypothetical protein